MIDHRARQITVDGTTGSGLWHFTAMRDGYVWPVGYCAGDGHDPHTSPDDAAECYRTYLLDHAHFDGVDPSTQRRCAVCEAWTSRFALARNLGTWPLCDEHCNRDGLAEVLEAPGSIITS